VTTSSGTGHLQKGHGVAFADWDGDGDQDIFLEAGGATPGDRAHNVLFENPGHGNHWLTIRLVGTVTNRAAIGARIRVDVSGAGNVVTSVHRMVTSGSSYGGNPFTQTIGLGKAATIRTVEIDWPTGHARQTIHDVPVDRSIEITEGRDGFRESGRTRLLPSELPPRRSAGASSSRSNTDSSFTGPELNVAPEPPLPRRGP
jgi:ASPIC and UnbV